MPFLQDGPLSLTNSKLCCVYFWERGNEEEAPFRPHTRCVLTLWTQGTTTKRLEAWQRHSPYRHPCSSAQLLSSTIKPLSRHQRKNVGLILSLWFQNCSVYKTKSKLAVWPPLQPLCDASSPRARHPAPSPAPCPHPPLERAPSTPLLQFSSAATSADSPARGNLSLHRHTWPAAPLSHARLG